jgi:hypothetical protein
MERSLKKLFYWIIKELVKEGFLLGTFQKIKIVDLKVHILHTSSQEYQTNKASPNAALGQIRRRL